MSDSLGLSQSTTGVLMPIEVEERGSDAGPALIDINVTAVGRVCVELGESAAFRWAGSATCALVVREVSHGE